VRLRLALLAALLAACRQAAPSASAPAPGASSDGGTAPAAPPRLPPTTDGTIMANELVGTIDMLAERIRRRGPDYGDSVPRLLEAYEQRAFFFGRIADYEAALALAERWVKEQPQAPEAYLARARARADLHLFEEALADVTRAETLGGKQGVAKLVLAEIAEATGDLDRAHAVREEADRALPGPVSAARLARSFAERGQSDQALALFAETKRRMTSSSAWQLALVLFQEGMVRERLGQTAEARALYEEAHARLPVFAAAASHLAALQAQAGEKERALATLAAIHPLSDDPELLAQRSELAGDAALVARARARYLELLAAHPAAYAAQAARFFLGAGKEPARALALARQNLAVRKTADAYQLAVEAALAAGDEGAACKLAGEGMGVKFKGKPALAVFWRAFTACKDGGRAAEVDALLKKPGAGGR